MVSGSALADDREVFVAMPASRLELPEQPTRRFSLGVAAVAFERARLASDQTTQRPDPERPVLLDDGAQWRVRADAVVSPWLTLTAKYYADKLAVGQMKVTPWTERRGATTLAVTLSIGRGTGSEAERFVYDDDPAFAATTTIDSNLLDAALILGWRASREWLLFGGPFYGRVAYDGRYVALQGPDFDQNRIVDGRVSQRGVNAGFAWRWCGACRVVAEYVAGELRGGDSTLSLGRLGAALEFEFGTPLPYVPPERERPIEVIPPDEPPAEAPPGEAPPQD